MKFIYFTDIHLCEGFDSDKGFERCLDSMLAHDPALLVNGGDLGVTPKAVSLYREMTKGLGLPLLHSNGNHEMCSGYLPRDLAGTASSSTDVDGVHFVILDVVRYFEPTEAHPANWHVLADESMLAWLEEDLSGLDRDTPLFVASHVPLSTTFPFRHGQQPGMDFPTNEVVNAHRILALLEPFANVATLHGHDHENCRHFVGDIEVMTTAAVAGNWWRNGLDSRTAGGREPQGYRLVNVDDNGAITSQYIPYSSDPESTAAYERRLESGRRFINVFDASPRTTVEVEGTPMNAIDPLAESSIHLSTHLYELPADFSSNQISARVIFEDGRVHDLDQTCEEVG